MNKFSSSSHLYLFAVDTLSSNVGKKVVIYTAVQPQKSKKKLQNTNFSINIMRGCGSLIK